MAASGLPCSASQARLTNLSARAFHCQVTGTVHVVLPPCCRSLVVRGVLVCMCCVAVLSVLFLCLCPLVYAPSMVCCICPSSLVGWMSRGCCVCVRVLSAFMCLVIWAAVQLSCLHSNGMQGLDRRLDNAVSCATVAFCISPIEPALLCIACVIYCCVSYFCTVS